MDPAPTLGTLRPAGGLLLRPHLTSGWPAATLLLRFNASSSFPVRSAADHRLLFDRGRGYNSTSAADAPRFYTSPPTPRRAAALGSLLVRPTPTLLLYCLLTRGRPVFNRRRRRSSDAAIRCKIQFCSTELASPYNGAIMAPGTTFGLGYTPFLTTVRATPSNNISTCPEAY